MDAYVLIFVLLLIGLFFVVELIENHYGVEVPSVVGDCYSCERNNGGMKNEQRTE